MLFGNLFKRTQPRGLTWAPRYHDPERDEERDYDPLDDDQLAERRRQSRIQFERYQSRRAGRRGGQNPFVLLGFVLLVGAVIWTAQNGPESGKIPEARIGSADAVLDPAAPQQPARFAAEELILEIEGTDGTVRHDTLRGNEVLRALEDASLEGSGSVAGTAAGETGPGDHRSAGGRDGEGGE